MPGTSIALPQACPLSEAAEAPVLADALPLASDAVPKAATMAIAHARLSITHPPPVAGPGHSPQPTAVAPPA